MSAEIVLPRILQVGAAASREVGRVLEDLNCNSPLIVTDAVMVELGYVNALLASLKEHKIQAVVFDETVPEPTVASIQKGLEIVQQRKFDCLIALGGGSPIDSAKAIAILATHGGDIRDYRVPRVVNALGLPIVAIPTTAGTGSEVTRFTVITDEGSDEKMLCVGKGFMPVAALVDYELTLSLPPRITADTGIDALTHAIEAYVSKKANQFSDSQALSAMKLIAPNLRSAFFNPSDQQARESLMLGSTLAGVAFSNASVALVHGMSRPIGAFFHVPHGLSNAMLLPSVTAYSIEGSEQRYADCARAMKVADPHDSDEVANKKLIKELLALNEDLKVPSLKEFGVSQATFDLNKQTMAEQALASGSPANNPRVPSIEEMITLYDSLW